MATDEHLGMVGSEIFFAFTDCEFGRKRAGASQHHRNKNHMLDIML